MGTRVQGRSLLSGANVDSGWANASDTIPGVASGSMLIAFISAYRYNTTTGELINGVSDNKGNTWVLAGKSIANQGGVHRVATYMYIAQNVASGSTTVSLDFTYEDDSTFCEWNVEEWSGFQTAGAVDVTASSSASSGTSISSGSTAGLGQSANTVFGMLAGPYIYAINDTGGSGAAPAGFTLLNGNTTQVVSDRLPFQTVYNNIVSQSAQSVAWTVPIDSMGVALVVVIQDAVATSLVVDVDFADALAASPPTEVHVWAGGRPDQVLSRRYTGSEISVTGSAGSYKLRLTPAPNGTSAAQQVTVDAYNATKSGPCQMTGTVVSI